MSLLQYEDAQNNLYRLLDYQLTILLLLDTADIKASYFTEKFLPGYICVFFMLQYKNILLALIEHC